MEFFEIRFDTQFIGVNKNKSDANSLKTVNEPLQEAGAKKLHVVKATK